MGMNSARYGFAPNVTQSGFTSQYGFAPNVTQSGFTPLNKRQVTTPYMGQAPKMGWMPSINRTLYGDANPSWKQMVGSGLATGAATFATTGNLPAALLATLAPLATTAIGGTVDGISNAIDWWRG